MSKIYLVTVSAGIGDAHVAQPRLVRAHTKAGALNHVASHHIDARLPTQDELVRAVTAGAEIIDATAVQP